jgi:hypothetical protein
MRKYRKISAGGFPDVDETLTHPYLFHQSDRNSRTGGEDWDDLL